MKKYLMLAVMVFVSAPAWAGEKAVPQFDGRDWKLGWSQNKDGGVFENYTVNGEKAENWSELVTIQFFPGLQAKTKPDIFEARNKVQLMQVCPDVQWDSVSHSDTERVWTWSVQGCPGQVDQSEMDRLVSTDEGVHIFIYAIKKAPMPEAKRAEWLKKIKAIKIEKK